MVLPPPTADDAPAPGRSDWLRRLRVALRLSQAGLLALVDHARPERLGELVRALSEVDPEVEVHVDARQLAKVTPRSTVVLVPRVTDADWLNLNRPLFATNELRVVLFCTRTVSRMLARKAVDFFDWISQRQDCPVGPARYAVAGLRVALAARVPGIVWTGGNLEAAFSEARPHRRLRRVSAARQYEELVAEASNGRGDWLAWTEVGDEFRLRRVRWALAEARRRTRAILVKPDEPSPGWWEVHGRVMMPRKARERLERAGARFPGRLAALVDLEPEAVDLLARLLERGANEEEWTARLLKATDPGAALGREALERGLFSERELARGAAPAPVMRALGAEGHGGVGTRIENELNAVEEKIWYGELLPEDAAWWAAWIKHSWMVLGGGGKLGRKGMVAEVLLRHKPRNGWIWESLAEVALEAGDMSVAQLWARQAAEADPQRWKVLAVALSRLGRHAEAAEILRQQLEATGQTDPRERGWILHTLAFALERQGKYAEAESLLRQSLAIIEPALGTRHPDYGASLSVLARVLERRGMYAKAESLLRQSLAIIEPALGTRHPDYGASLHVLAQVLERQGMYAEAESLLHQSLAIVKQAVEARHPDYGASLHELARVLVRQGKYAEAEPLLRQSLAIDEQAMGDRHPNYGTSLNVLAGVLEGQGKYAEAESLLRQSLAIYEQVLGAQHPDYGTSLHELARVLERQGKYAEAESLLRQSLAIREQALGARHPDYGQSLRALAVALEQQGRYAEAELLLRQSLSIIEQALGALHPDLVPTLTSLGSVLARQELPEQGEPLVQRAVDIAFKSLGPAHPDIAQPLVTLARLQAQMKKPEAAETSRRARDVLLNSLGPEHPLTREYLPEVERIIQG